MYDKFKVKSYIGEYYVEFSSNILNLENNFKDHNTFFVIDKKVYEIYYSLISKLIKNNNYIVIESNEKNKSFEELIKVYEYLIEKQIRRGQNLTAIGGGIIQDITCFIASTLFRGLEWNFVPTTLLAQADSCIGSKSSINLGSSKNILGTYCPPKKIYICEKFLNSLDKVDILSGIGEIIKVHIIAGQKEFSNLKKNYDNLVENYQNLLPYIYSSLKIKKKYIEIDEFDKGIRNIFNYGHSFGHALESATNFNIPHGIAISYGMDIANHIAVQRNLISENLCKDMHILLNKNYQKFKKEKFSSDNLFNELLKDKKNRPSEITLILPKGENAELQKVFVKPDQSFIDQLNHTINFLKNE